MCQIDKVENAEDQRQAGCHKKQEQAELEAVQRLNEQKSEIQEIKSRERLFMRDRRRIPGHIWKGPILLL